MNLAATSTAIDDLLKDKEFRILSAPLMRHVISTSTLTDGAKVLWFSLWELCALETERKRKLTLGFLAKRLDKSVDTIRRYVNQLQSNGYLAIDEQYDVNQRQLPSIYRVTAPEQVVAVIRKQIPDRKGRRIDQIIEVKSSEITASTKHVDAEVNYQFTNSESVNYDNGNLEECSKIQLDVDVASTTHVETSDSHTRDCKLVQRLNAIRARAGYLLEAQQQTVNKLGSNGYKHEGQRRVLTSPDRSVYEQHDEDDEGGKLAIDRGSRFASQESIPKEDNNKRTNEPGGLRFWIYRQIKQRKALNSDPWRYVDEIAVAIEKGSLAKFNLAKAINIALKLIREGRWTAPRFVI